METLLRDIRYGMRALTRSRGFALAALLTIALGIGANTAIFSVVNGVLLRPLPYDDADRIAILWLRNAPEGIDEDITSFPNFSDWRDRNGSFSHMAAIAGASRNLTDGDSPEQVRVALVTADFFDVFAAATTLGRTLLPEENEAGRERVAVIGHELWIRRFGADSSIVNRTIELNGAPHTVVGVLPPEFAFPERAEIWLPLAPVGGIAQSMQSRGSLWLQVVGRLRDNVTLERAQAEMSAISQALADEFPTQQGYGVNIELLHDEIVGEVRPALLLLFGAVGFVLLIACANVANLLLARGAVRQTEISVRLALGADRPRIARQLLTESLVLSLAGGALGLLLAGWAVGLLAGAAPADLPRLDNITVDATVAGFALIAAVVSGLLFGLAPVVQASRTSLGTTLRTGGRGSTGSLLDRLRPVLVAAEIALALMLMVGAGLLIRSVAALQEVDPGFATQGRLTFRVTLPASRYGDEGAVTRFYDTLVERLEANESVQSVAGMSTLFLQRLPNMSPITVEGHPPEGPDAPRISVTTDAVLGDLPATLGMRIVSGRWFSAADDERVPPVAIVNQTFVRTFLVAGEEPIGTRFVFGQPGDNATPSWITIVGVLADSKRSGLAQPVRPEALFPHAQARDNALQIIVATRAEPMAILPAVHQVMREIDPAQPIAQVSTIDATLASAIATRRFVMQLLSLFSAVAVTLSAIGIYGVMVYLVSQRTRELGVRMAIGAQRTHVLNLVLRDAAHHILPGLALGTTGALALSRFLRSQLFGVSPTDPLTLLAVVLLFTVVAIVASCVPAWRAARVQPMDALRFE